MKTALCLLGLLAGSLTCLAQAPPTYVPDGDWAFLNSKHGFHYVGDNQPLQEPELREVPDQEDAVGPIPVPAEPHSIEVAESERAYADGRYAEAAEAVAALARLEPADPSVLKCYARALYREEDTREQSRPVYNKLIALLDSYGHDGPHVVSVYLPYVEAYFKLATLQLDSEEWAAASYNLSRAARGMQTLDGVAADNQPLREQILQYQTECFAHLGNVALCRYFGQRTLRFFPKNQYVRPYLAALPKPTGKPAARPRR